jgi:hypothetical protein
MWDGRDWTEQQPLLSLGARSEAHMAFDKKRWNVVLFGGCCESTGGKFGDTLALTVKLPGAYLPLIAAGSRPGR